MLRALILLCVLAGVATAEDPVDGDGTGTPSDSKTLERGIKLFNLGDFYSAMIELKKVVDGETGDDERGKTRARLFLGKAVDKGGFPIAALAHFNAIALGDSSNRQMVGDAIRALVNSDYALVAVSGLQDVDTSGLDSTTRDALRFHMGATTNDQQQLEAVTVMSPFRSKSRLWLGRLLSRESFANGSVEMRKVDAALGHYNEAANDPAVRPGVALDLAAWGLLVLQTGGADAPKAFSKVRSALLQLAPRDPHAAYYASRLALDDKRFPNLVTMPIGAFDAIAIATACSGSGSDARDAVLATGSALTARIDQLLGLDDNAEIYEAIKKLDTTTPEGRALLHLFADPRLADRIAYVAELNRELKHVSDSDKAWQTTQVAAEVLQELTVQEAVARADLGKGYREILEYARSYMGSFSTVFNGATGPLAISSSNVKPGEALAVSEQLCKAGAGGNAIAASGTTQAKGCGCRTSGGNSWLAAVLVLGAVTRRRRRQLRAP